MKIIFFTYDFPFPTNSGGKTRAYNLLKFAKSDIDINLYSFVREDFDENNIQKIKDLGIKKIKIFKRRKLRDPKNFIYPQDLKSSIFRRLYFRKEILQVIEKDIIEEKIDLVHLESFYTSFYINERLQKKGVKFIFGTENLEHKIYQDYTKYLSHFLLKPIYYFESMKVKREEISLLQKADASVAVTEEEAVYIRNATHKNCYVIENGIDLDYFKFHKRKDKVYKNILFVGNFTYFPNIHAVKSFYDKVFKDMRENNIFFTIVGKGSKKLSFSKDPQVKTFEFVKDIRDAYSEADVFVFPVKFGGGTNFKILEAMASGVPVVADKSRIESLGVEKNQDLLIAENLDDFKQEILKVFDNSKIRDKITENARKFVEEKYSWDKIGKKLNNTWKEIVEYSFAVK